MLNINELIKSSMKSGDKVALLAYKNLKSEIQKVKTAKNAKPYTDTIEIQLISKMCKNLEDAILDFSKAHRDDLVADYTSELEVLKKLLPEPVNESQICSFIEKYCLKNNFVGNTEGQENTIQIPKKEMGKVIKVVKETYPQADGKLISYIVKKYVI
nr:MAG TPA: YqeY-like protein [Bacteriophage sp.]